MFDYIFNILAARKRSGKAKKILGYDSSGAGGMFDPPTSDTAPTTGLIFPSQNNNGNKVTVKGPANAQGSRVYTLQDGDVLNLRLASNFLNTDATGTPVNVTGMSFPLAANQIVTVEGILIIRDPNYSAACFGWTYPAGCTFAGVGLRQTTANGLYTVTNWRYDLDLGAATEVGEINSGSVSSQLGFNQPLRFTLLFVNGSTAGNVQLRFANRSGDGTEMGLVAGSFFKVIY